MKISSAKPVKVGNSYYFTIPKQYINNGIVELDKRYNIDVEIDSECLSDLAPKRIEKITQARVMKQTKEVSGRKA